ncbi:polycystin-2 [Thecamonas trahens ATCC 50062]|uniref:Polycystin-2 n=1 Tax=Thecamonas trahens ATCC 50062 TaxID=461836 RepID=A0A0L0D5E1_THETB|nr:polycystin-2 [Thecamonas trahens ATCC 50062]KNC47301.1 polycystin-2 [Thecamonas trahens ATCC 50062]|eukprot:XP_013759642.1 polycystin-2 [Thecamonas trahens ATCC 50062]
MSSSSSSTASASSANGGTKPATKSGETIRLDEPEELPPIANEVAIPLEPVNGGGGEHGAGARDEAGEASKSNDVEGGQTRTQQVTGYVLRARDVVMASLEVVLYILFLVAFCLMAYGARNSTYSYHYNALMKDLFLEEEFPVSSSHILKNFYDCATIEEVWQYLNGPFLAGLADNGSNGPDGYIYGVNRLIGMARLRQLRVKPGKCPLLGAFKSSFAVQGCLAPYKEQYESRETFSAGTAPFRYASESEVGGFEVLGRITRYDGGGFVEYFNGTSSDASKMAFLQTNNWLDVQTRVVVVDFSTYNANINMFFVGQMVFEFLPSGGVVPSSVFRVIRFYRYPPTASGRFQIFLELTVAAFVLFYVLQELFEMKQKGIGYLSDGWNFFDIVNLLLFITLFVFRIIITVEFNKLQLTNFEGSLRYYNFTNLVTLSSAEFNILSLNGFLLFFKVLKYARFSKSALIITKTIKRAVLGIAALTVMVMFLLLGFAFFGNQSFGTDVDSYRTFTFSLLTMVRGLLGELDFESLWANNRLMGPIFYLAFVILFVFILMSVYISVIDDAYGRVQDKYENRPNPHALWMTSLKDYAAGHMPAKVKSWREALRKQKEIERAQRGVLAADTNNDDKIDRSEAQALLAQQQDMAQYLGVDNVDDLFAMYDADQDGQLDLEEQAAIMARLEEERARYSAICQDLATDGAADDSDLPPPSAHTAMRLRALAAADDDRDELGTRVESLETLVASLHGKLDVALDFLRSITAQQARARRRRRTASVNLSQLADARPAHARPSSTMQ